MTWLIVVSIAVLGAPGVIRAPRPRAPLIFLDPGHGGMNTGAIGVGGLKEREITLDVALRLRSLIEARGNARVLLSRTADHFVGLRERTREANEAGAAVFLSIHANASPSPDAHGASVYLLAAGSAQDEGMVVVRREEGSCAIGSSPKESKGSLVSVLRGLRLAGAQRASFRLAGLVIDGLIHTTSVFSRGVHQAAFAVLKEAQMPALVVEVGFVTNHGEAAHLADPAYRDRLALGLDEALQRWQKDRLLVANP